MTFFVYHYFLMYMFGLNEVDWAKLVVLLNERWPIYLHIYFRLLSRGPRSTLQQAGCALAEV